MKAWVKTVIGFEMDVNTNCKADNFIEFVEEVGNDVRHRAVEQLKSQGYLIVDSTEVFFLEKLHENDVGTPVAKLNEETVKWIDHKQLKKIMETVSNNQQENTNDNNADEGPV